MKTEIKKYESTTQPGLFFWAEANGGGAGPAESYGVVSQVTGFPATEAHDDWFAHFKDADEIAQRLARGLDVADAHTFGTWQAGDTQRQYGDAARKELLGCTVNVSTRDQLVAAVYGFTPEEAEANARFVVAAPRMLAALRALVGEADLGEVDLDDEDRAKVEEARALIAEVEGRA